MPTTSLPLPSEISYTRLSILRKARPKLSARALILSAILRNSGFSCCGVPSTLKVGMATSSRRVSLAALPYLMRVYRPSRRLISFCCSAANGLPTR
ncbi:hypothetical protein D3C81_1630030 [compost metagenome]